MFLPLTISLLVVTVSLALYAGYATIAGRAIDNPMFYLTIAVEVLLVIQLIAGVLAIGSADPHMSRGIFIAYLVGLILVPPVALFWSIAERQSRWGTAVLLVAAVGLAIMVGRLVQLWNGHA